MPEAIADFAERFNIPIEIASRDLQLTWSQWRQLFLAPVPPQAPVISPPSPGGPQANAFSRTYCWRGQNIRVILHDAELIAEIVPRLEPIPSSAAMDSGATLQAARSENGFHVFSDSRCVATEDHAATARVVFLQEFVRHSRIERQWAAVLHAGACGSEHRCVVFPAASHSGKTTLAAALMHAGMVFYGDDSIPLESDSLAIPAMPFALMIREGSWLPIAERFPDFHSVPVHDRYGDKVRFLHPTFLPHDTSVQAVAIVFSRWEVGARTSIAMLDTFDALIRLKDSGFWVAHDHSNIRAFLDWIQSLSIYEMIYSDLDEAIKFIRELIR